MKPWYVVNDWCCYEREAGGSPGLKIKRMCDNDRNGGGIKSGNVLQKIIKIINYNYDCNY